MKEVKITNLVKLYAILLLQESPKHGYEIIKEISEKLGKNVSPGEIYPFLSKLEKNRYIESKVTGKRDKKVFSLTKDGKVFVRKMLDRFGGLIDIAIEPRITVCAHCGCEIYRGGHKERINNKTLNFCCHHCARSYKNS